RPERTAECFAPDGEDYADAVSRTRAVSVTPTRPLGAGKRRPVSSGLTQWGARHWQVAPGVHAARARHRRRVVTLRSALFALSSTQRLASFDRRLTTHISIHAPGPRRGESWEARTRPGLI